MKKKESAGEIFIFFLLFGVVLVGISLLFMMMEVHTVLPTEDDPWIVMKTASDLNVRTSPVFGDVVEVLPEGTLICVQAPKVRGYDSWGRLQDGDGEYWVNCYFLKEEEPAEAAEEEEYAAEEEECAAEEEEYAAEEEECVAEEEEYAAEESP